ncbi:MAG TPA: bifunctional demethylmenaquinone methyltransferase/2-methoxy-6-polyprenyl-1,4-benzoquinol methylase UbiE [Rhodospirillaceae bacterium]|nr:bifunctional demethylmenaquinone methyltransferase/2-methoxy-6-polyprenyl-1,4-benzoquinol methylase UbiE [Rhodospirillaceae bacterium]
MKKNPESGWFGYTRTSPEEKTARVASVFSSVAENYDLMNDFMSGGLHRPWKDHFVAKMRPRAGEAILDVAGGTGDIALRCAKKLREQSLMREAQSSRENITICDINPDMIKVGQAKAIDQGYLTGLNWVVGNAEKLPFADNSFDLLSISFGLRNVTHIDEALAEFARVLKTGGRFYCMEFSSGVISPLKKIYDLYSFSVLPWLGEKVANDREAYQYLAESIRQFPDQTALTKRIKNASFDNVRHENLMGGIAAIHSGWIL